MVVLKTIDYRGGLLRFRIPGSWLEEYEPDGGGTFYRDEADSGTLRLNILTFEGNAKPDKQALLKAVASSGPAEWLSTGNAFVSYRETGSGTREPLTVFQWKVANAVEPRHLRLALFSYTVALSHAESAEVLGEVRLLTDEIRMSQFAATLGVVPS